MPSFSIHYYGLLAHRLIRVIVYLDQYYSTKCNVRCIYRKLLDLENSNYLLWYKNTLKVSVLTMIFSVLAISFTAYAFSRYRFVGRKMVY